MTRAKGQLEGLRQKSEDTITEHVNEFRRRLEVLQQAKGGDKDAGYADYELRDLLVRSLYSPMWTPWVENREDTDTMPATFEDLVLALKKAETKRILRLPSPIDAHMPSAHVTRTLKRGDTSPSTPTSSTPVKCQVCGKFFYPRRSSHLRCDKCQLDYSTKNKKSGRTPDKKSKRSPPKKVHATVADDSIDDDNDSDRVTLKLGSGVGLMLGDLPLTASQFGLGWMLRSWLPSIQGSQEINVETRCTSPGEQRDLPRTPRSSARTRSRRRESIYRSRRLRR